MLALYLTCLICLLWLAYSLIFALRVLTCEFLAKRSHPECVKYFFDSYSLLIWFFQIYPSRSSIHKLFEGKMGELRSASKVSWEFDTTAQVRSCSMLRISSINCSCRKVPFSFFNSGDWCVHSLGNVSTRMCAFVWAVQKNVRFSIWQLLYSPPSCSWQNIS